MARACAQGKTKKGWENALGAAGGRWWFLIGSAAVSFRPEANGRSGEISPRMQGAPCSQQDVSTSLCSARHDNLGSLRVSRGRMVHAAGFRPHPAALSSPVARGPRSGDFT